MAVQETLVSSAPVSAGFFEEAFWPAEPRSIEETGLSESTIESLVCQVLVVSGTVAGRRIADRTGLPFAVIDQMLGVLRTRQLVVHARPAAFNDYYYSLTENGRARAQMLQKSFIYTGPAPVPLAEFLISVEAQGKNFAPIRKRHLIEALANITYEESWLDFIGPAINSGRGIFLYGSPGNGKTTLAKCLTAAMGQSVWIPHAIIDDGMIIKLFDHSVHQKLSEQESSALVDIASYDRRWIRIKRPTVVVGGELTMENLELRHDPRSNTCEAPLQMKSNCGCLLIDDFGRQRIAPAELLNRWIIPLENRIDYLTLPTGKKIAISFEQTILFSTNHQPESLVDEAFMRRVPFKIEIGDPSESEFRKLFRKACEELHYQWRPRAFDHLVEKHYRSKGRPFRRCHARDLMHQVKSFCLYSGSPNELREEYLDLACRNYFGSSTTSTTVVGTNAPPSPTVLLSATTSDPSSI
jgi:predicted ATPase with chaperone activity